MARLVARLLAAVWLFSGAAGAVPVQWTVGSGGNGHFYEFVAQTGLSWTQADTAATGAGGYLATVTSAAEQAFLESLPKASGSYWAGGQDVASEGVWRWVTGPEAGDQFFGPGTPAGAYENFLAGQPSNSSGGEDYLVFNQNSGGAGWNDVSIANSTVKGYVLEIVPEPGTAGLLAVGLFGLAARARRARSGAGARHT